MNGMDDDSLLTAGALMRTQSERVDLDNLECAQLQLH